VYFTGNSAGTDNRQITLTLERFDFELNGDAYSTMNSGLQKQLGILSF